MIVKNTCNCDHGNQKKKSFILLDNNFKYFLI